MTTEKKICPKCGKLLSVHSNRCENCSHLYDSTAYEAKPVPNGCLVFGLIVTFLIMAVTGSCTFAMIASTAPDFMYALIPLIFGGIPCLISLGIFLHLLKKYRARQGG